MTTVTDPEEVRRWQEATEAVDAIAKSFPDVCETTRYGNKTWAVGGKGFIWMRPFTKADIKGWGDSPRPNGPLLGVNVEDLGEKEAILGSSSRAVFTIEHFNNYAAVLIDLDNVDQVELLELITDAWICTAPAKLRAQYLEQARLPD